MILSVDINEKSFGNNVLYKDLHFDVQDNEKVALVGRNGTGKTTLLHIITGQDKDYDGEIRLKKVFRLLVAAKNTTLTIIKQLWITF